MEGYIDESRWIDLSVLPHRGNRVNWAKSIGMTVNFKYGKASGDIYIIEYKTQKHKSGTNMAFINIFIPLYMQKPQYVNICVLKKCQLYDLVGNKIIDYAPQILPYIMDINDAYKYSCHSISLIQTKCPICGNIRWLCPDLLVSYGFYCLKCSDGISIPNKIMRNILEQLNIDFINEVSKKYFPWMQKYLYDFYFKTTNNESVLIEMDGGWHRYNEQKQRDINKDKLAKENGFKLIRIKCDYGEQHQEAIQYIKNNIINSELTKFLPIKNVDWNKCIEATKNNVLTTICYLWEDKLYSIPQIADKVKMHRTSICTYLKKGKQLGLAPSYNTFSALSRGRTKCLALIENNQIKNVFRNKDECADILQQQTGQAFSTKVLTECANGYLKSYHGLFFKYITKEQYEQYKMILQKNDYINKEVPIC